MPPDEPIDMPLAAGEAAALDTPAVDTPAAPPAESGQTDDSGLSKDETMDFVLSAFEPMTTDFDDENTETITPQEFARREPVAPVEPTPAASPATTPAVKTPAAAVVPPVVATPPVAAAATPAAQPVSAADPPSGQQPLAVEPEKLLDKIADEVSKHQEVFTQALAQQTYKLSEKEVEDLGFAPEQAQAISHLQAKVHVGVVSSVMRTMAQQMPAYVAGLLHAQKIGQERENLFWNANPFLDKAKHSAQVEQVMRTVRQLNPNMPRDQFIKQVGIISAGLVGVSPTAPPAAPAASQPPVRTPGPIVRRVQQPSYNPAGATAAPASAHPAPQLSEWDRMAQLINADDQGQFDN